MSPILGSAPPLEAAAATVSLASSASLVLMLPTTLCNLDCTYCYLPERSVSRRMSPTVADAVAATVRRWSALHPVTLLWHGGEPLAAGRAHVRGLMDRFPAGPAVRHAVQTNGTLIDEGWCELFAERSVDVGVSLDGPGPNNRARVDLRGQNSVDRTLRGVALLRRYGVPFSVIAVVSDPSAARAVLLYEWAAELGAHTLGVNFCERKGVHRGDSGEAHAVEFWAALAARWKIDRRLKVRELSHAFGYFADELAGLAQARAERSINPMPMVTWDGEVVPMSPDLAGFASPRLGAFTVGNVLTAPLDRLLAEAARAPWVAEALAGIAACRRACDHFAFCRGGQAANKYFESGRLDITQTSYCRTSKIALIEGLFRHVANSTHP
ncbi:cyclophane-forming radical SAM peptide maturase AmcB [Nannocystis punicea]|uniref:Radical SAM protein n=1 Tax=Nannocystis punicea TaxID=2995304 RepID=A0ABY7GX66_9BACT|nr:cyclophane-forming radical SAM peptide maturase AmcB [Nannocystis poenicansa]WAS91517.1 radical SAM protein [Nannocystis poenicansa]